MAHHNARRPVNLCSAVKLCLQLVKLHKVLLRTFLSVGNYTTATQPLQTSQTPQGAAPLTSPASQGALNPASQRLFVGLIIFTPGTLLNIYILLIPVISEHWTDIGAAGWLLLLIFGMGSQLI